MFSRRLWGLDFNFLGAFLGQPPNNKVSGASGLMLEAPEAGVV